MSPLTMAPSATDIAATDIAATDIAVRTVAAEVELISVTDLDGPTVREATARLVLAADELVFDGHYPGFPIFPGVCLIESAHRAALACAPEPGLALDGVESARFLGPSFPGDVLSIELAWKRAKDGWQVRASVGTERGECGKIRLRYTVDSA